jgi:hypothetical protein
LVETKDQESIRKEVSPCRLGISRKTFYKWEERFAQAKGECSALLDRSRRPPYPKRYLKKGLQRKILALRQQTRLGPKESTNSCSTREFKNFPDVFDINKEFLL